LPSVWWCDEKQIPPQPPFKKGEKKAPDFLKVNDETRPLEISNKSFPKRIKSLKKNRKPYKLHRWKQIANLKK
jgi:hypothetical protein